MKKVLTIPASKNVSPAFAEKRHKTKTPVIEKTCTRR